MQFSNTIVAHAPLSAFSSELLHRVYFHVNNPGAFGRIIQLAVVYSLDRIYPGVLENPGAGVPDVRCTDDDGNTWSWEVKHTTDGMVLLSDREIDGLRSQSTNRPRLVAINLDFPVQVWVLDGIRIEPGTVALASRDDAAIPDEASSLVVEIENLLLRADVDLITAESEAKDLLRRCAHSN